jgi:hypothetical protein
MTPKTGGKNLRIYKPVSSFTISQKQFAELIGRSPAEIDLLRKLGVVHYCAVGVIFARSLDIYFNSYLKPHRRLDELKAMVRRINNAFYRRFKNPRGIDAARAIMFQIVEMQKLLQAAKFVNRLYPIKFLIDKIEEKIKHLQDRFSAAKSKVFELITAAKLSAEIENILIYRYCDCETFSECAEICGYSLPYVYTLHRRGIMDIKKYC